MQFRETDLIPSDPAHDSYECCTFGVSINELISRQLESFAKEQIKNETIYKGLVRISG